MAASSALDTTIAVVTPENIAFEYQLAGPFRRLPAYLIDVATRWFVLGAMFLFVVFVMGMTGLGTVAGPYLAAGGFITYFLVSWFYGTILETYFNGRTVGKWACGIRVIDIEGRPINGSRALIRNLLRVADFWPLAAPSQFSSEVPPLMVIPTGMVALVFIIMTRRMQRLGDLAAGTMVIVDERTWELPVVKVDDPRVVALASYLPGDYRVSRSMARTLAIYAERRHFLTPARRREIASQLTDPLLDRFEFRRDIDADLLMYSLYYKTFLADPRAELPDLGSLAGYSPLLRDVKPEPVPISAQPAAVAADDVLPATAVAGADARAEGDE